MEQRYMPDSEILRLPATEADVEKGIAIFWIPDSRSKLYDLGGSLPLEAFVVSDLDVGNKQFIPAGTIIWVVQAEIVDDSEILLGFKYSEGQGICTLDQVEFKKYDGIRSEEERVN
jgi:hypothetical protein